MNGTIPIELVKHVDVTTRRLPSGAQVMELQFQSLIRPDDPQLRHSPRMRLQLNTAEALLELIQTGLAVMRGQVPPIDPSPRH